MSTQKTEIATLAGGCFWCTEAVFMRLKGVSQVVSGYTGGTKPNPTYQDVTSQETGHAEAIQITFNPEVISFAKLLDVFWRLHDPTTLNRQGNDTGTQYRSAIFYHSDEQRHRALKSRDDIIATKLYPGTIVTEINPAKEFYSAEKYHQNYYESNSYQPYCQYVIDPKITKLYKEFKSDLKPEYQKLT